MSDAQCPYARPMNSRRLVIAAMALALLGCGATVYWLRVLRDHRMQFTTRQVRLQTAALAEHASVVLGAVDATLRGAVRDVREAGGVPPNAHRSLRQRVGGNPALLALTMVDAQGRVLATSSDDPATLPRRDAIELAHAVADGGDVARVVAQVDNRFVDEFFGRIAVADDARAALFTRDGQRLAGTLAWSDVHDRGSPALFVTALPVDGQPMIAATSRDRRAVFEPWLEYVVSAVITTAIALAVLAFIVHRLQHEMKARLQAQAALHRTQRLEAIGRLAGGIAHDFNNILALILGFGDLLLRHAAPGSTVAQHAEQVVRAGERGRHLVGRILSLTSGQKRSAVPIEVDALVGEAIDLQRAAAPPLVAFDLSLNAPGAIVMGDASMLFEALGNLCANALHASADEGGRIRVQTSFWTTTTPLTLSHGTLAAGRHVRIAIEDDGHGMPPAVLEQLFEPFFTTRQAQGGTGLGLAVVHGAVKEMGGAIDVRSTPRSGSRFELVLPCRDRRIADRAATEHDADAETRVAELPRGRGQVVMIVDDEPALVALTEELLADLGYEPAGFSEPATALRLLRRSPERYDALLTDQVMPGITGLELARAWRALRPQAPILLATGFSGADLRQRARDAGVSALLDKPLQRGELARQLAGLFAATVDVVR